MVRAHHGCFFLYCTDGSVPLGCALYCFVVLLPILTGPEMTSYQAGKTEKRLYFHRHTHTHTFHAQQVPKLEGHGIQRDFQPQPQLSQSQPFPMILKNSSTDPCTCWGQPGRINEGLWPETTAEAIQIPLAQAPITTVWSLLLYAHKQSQNPRSSMRSKRQAGSISTECYHYWMSASQGTLLGARSM